MQCYHHYQLYNVSKHSLSHLCGKIYVLILEQHIALICKLLAEAHVAMIAPLVMVLLVPFDVIVGSD